MSTRLFVRCGALLAFLAASPPAVPDELAAQEPAAAQTPWTRIATGTGTGCALGTPYSFFHREGTDPDRLLIYFQGGGACWEWVSCSGMFDATVEDTEPFAFRGIFDRAEARNPLRAYSVVFVPYCSGDVHIGEASVSYGDATRPVGHRGFRNVSAVLDWIGARAFRPRTVVVAGTSAGAYGALFYMRAIARLFPDARLVLLGDSGVPLLSRNEEVLKTWGASSVMAALWQDENGPRTLLEAYRQAALIGPRVRLAHITSDRDAVQSAFYLISGSPDWRRATYSLLADVKNAVPAFRSFIVAGADHGLLPVDAFYSYRSDHVVLHEWLGRLVAGESVEDVRCVGCVQ
jgi:Pectinacetylesterase